jgi:hypothetical protein
MNETGDGGIRRMRMDSIVGFEDTQEDLSLDVDSQVVLERRAKNFKSWLGKALPKGLKPYVCFVDYTVFQDVKLSYPYFYLVAPSEETKTNYQRCVENLISGTAEHPDCFSVAYHPEFVGIRRDSETPNSLAEIRLSAEPVEQIPPTESRPPVNVKTWFPSFYPLWPKNEGAWPPTTRDALNRICGQHSLRECLEKFQSILWESRWNIQDTFRRPLNVVFCVPFLVSNPSGSVRSDRPFSEIAAALFLGVSFEGTARQRHSVMQFIRTVALFTYRITAVRKGEHTGELQGWEQAIEGFAHQIKGVANAMSRKWAIPPETWEEIKAELQNEPGLEPYLKAIRILPAPVLLDAVKETLVLWSQTRRIGDLFPTLPNCFEDVIKRAWDLNSRNHYAQEKITSNFNESSFDLVRIWHETETKAPYPEIAGDVNSPWPDWGRIDLKSEGLLCSLTRLLVAIFDNTFVHGMRDEPINVNFTFNTETKLASLSVINKVARKGSNDSDRLRMGMQGNEVLDALTQQLNGQLKLPSYEVEVGDDYVVEVQIPGLGLFFSN